VFNRATFGKQWRVGLPGRTVMFVVVEKKIAGLVAVADPIKQTTAEAMSFSSVSVIMNALRLRRVDLTA
jgi:cation transport ATPase